MDEYTFLPCPFCGGDQICVHEWPYMGVSGFSCVCRCRAEGPEKSSEAEAVSAWNERAHSASDKP